MNNELIINVRSYETRIALVENGTVVEFYLERPPTEGIAGNIYKGKIIRVLPGMQSAFVDIGQERAAFLYVGDVYDQEREFEQMLTTMEREGNSLSEVSPDLEKTRKIANDRFQIEDLLHEGQEIIVQVSKEPIGNKGARVTSYVTLPGRHLVFMPTIKHIGISRRIADEEERQRLKHIIEDLNVAENGFIARTASEGVSMDRIKPEMEFLIKLWNRIQEQAKHAQIPSLLHQDLDAPLRAVRDLFTQEVDRLVVDSESEYNKILKFIDTFSPHLKSSVELYRGPGPICDYYDLETEINRALARKVWLKSGGYIVIEETEALVTIDVNTGRYVGKHNLEETIIKTNLDAVKEIAYQLRLRNIGGLIVIDFIDMEREANREKVRTALIDILRRDKAKTNVLKMSELGLIEMTRQRTRDSIGRVLSEPCFYCQGEGCLLSETSICYEAFRDLEREAVQSSAISMTLTVNPKIKERLLDEEQHSLNELELRLGKHITVREDPSLHLENYRVETG
ncbi:MAG: Rne/Rng family ribonuclease [Deltaproteobacteria bacterium]|nr:Rne/Rng family ribonuclease [Deltaproteobacteria bacterium]